ncbi:hypothetical protein [Flagellimonas lutimaris]|uniref:hypothetical protein n=1 Tax=Flagellimonas lutimaris TaxID=475082 RepID=UPI003F5CC1D9
MIKEVETYLVDIETRKKFGKALLQYSVNPTKINLRTNLMIQVIVSGIDLLDCYRKLQIHLEEKGCLICLNGSRKDVQASGFLRDSSNGISTYQLTYDFDAEKPVLNIFDICEPHGIGTIKEQKDFMKKWKIEYKKYLAQQS